MTGRLDALEANLDEAIVAAHGEGWCRDEEAADMRTDTRSAFAELRRARDLRAAMLAAIPYRVATCAYHRRANEAAVGAIAMGWLSE